LIVGSGSTGTTTPTILVLDNKSSSGDPTGVNGAMYYNASSHAFRCYEDGQWQDCGGLVFANTLIPGGNTQGVSSNAENNFASNYTLPANYCQPGRVIRVSARGTYSSSAGGPTIVVKVKFGSTVIGASAATGAPGNSLVNVEWLVDFDITCISTGVSGSVEGQGKLVVFNNNTGTSTADISMQNAGTVTVDTTSTQVLQLSEQYSAISASDGMTLRQLIVEGIGP
jgi:hypothetical protein